MKTVADRLKKFSVPNIKTGCIEWSGCRLVKGYGRINIKTKALVAHRVAWELVNGPISKGMLVLHKCDNPPCINPDHLFLGTAADNAADRDSKGRRMPPKGILNGGAKLTEEAVIKIRQDKRLLREIAAEYGVNYSAISGIRLNRSWKHLPDTGGLL